MRSTPTEQEKKSASEPTGAQADELPPLRDNDVDKVLNAPMASDYYQQEGQLAHARMVVRKLVRDLEAARGERDEWKKNCSLLTHQLITCGVAASHPDATLSSRGKDYGGPWDSPQAQQVRTLRAALATLRAQLASAEAELTYARTEIAAMRSLTARSLE